MFRIHTVSDDFFQLKLEFESPELREVLGSTNVYVCVGESVCLIGGGHHSQRDVLRDALAQIGLTFADIERVIYPSWATQNTGISTLETASHFVASPDYWRPTDHARELIERQESLNEILKSLDADPKLADAFWGPEFSWDIVPLRDQHMVNAGNMDLQVHVAPGPDPGHMLLYAQETGRLFTSELEYTGLPFWIEEAQGYLVGLERGIALKPQWILPNRGEPSGHGHRTLQRALRWSNNFLTHVSGLLMGAPTLRQYVERDLGRDALPPLELALRMLTVRPFLEELERSQMIQSSGTGLNRRYGTNIAAPPSRLRPF